MSTDGLVEQEMFETTQTNIAAFFVYCGIPVKDLVWESGLCTYFFDDTLELQKWFSDYVKGKARVEPQGFNNCYVQVRNQMYQARDKSERKKKERRR